MARGIGEIGLYPLSIYYTTNVWKKDHGKNKGFFFQLPCLVINPFTMCHFIIMLDVFSWSVHVWRVSRNRVSNLSLIRMNNFTCLRQYRRSRHTLVSPSALHIAWHHSSIHRFTLYKNHRECFKRIQLVFLYCIEFLPSAIIIYYCLPHIEVTVCSS